MWESKDKIQSLWPFVRELSTVWLQKRKKKNVQVFYAPWGVPLSLRFIA